MNYLASLKALAILISSCTKSGHHEEQSCKNNEDTTESAVTLEEFENEVLGYEKENALLSIRPTTLESVEDPAVYDKYKSSNEEAYTKDLKNFFN